jgi:hypothetical protein
MFEKPHLMSTSAGYRIGIAQEHSERLLNDLREADFDARLLPETVGYEDFNSDIAREEVAFIQLPLSTRNLELRRFLRGWVTA